MKKYDKVKGSAPGQYLGYALQPVRLFYHLLTCDPDADVGLEYLDDVSIHNATDTLLVEQCKSALSQNPLSDWSIDLWKTFANWVDNAKDGVFDPEKTKFQLYVTPQKSGKLVESLNDAASDTEIATILDKVAKRLTKREKPPACDLYLKSVLSADSKVLTAIIRNFSLVSDDDDPLCPILAHLDATVSKETVKAACKFGIGQAKGLAEKRIKDGEVPIVSAQAFRLSFKAFIAKYDVANVLHSLSDAPSDEVVQEVLTDAPPFVMQLVLVGANAEIKTRAASDFLRSSADRTNWADQGTIFENSVAEYDDALKQRHLNLKGEVDLTSAKLPEDERGLLLYHRCCADTPTPLQGRVVPHYFMPGSLNTIANRLEIGWHPNFAQLLKLEDA